MLSADSGNVLAAASAEASTPAELLLTSVDAVSRDLRIRIGESRRAIKAAVQLERVTTSSIDALEKFTAAGAAARRGDWALAVPLLQQAVRIDSTFALAWRMLSSAYANSRLGGPALQREAAERAYTYRDHLPEAERYAVERRHFLLLHERQRVIALDEAQLARGDSSVANGLVQERISRREFARAETLQRAARRQVPTAISYLNLPEILVDEGKFAAAESAIAETERRFPARTALQRARLACLRGDGSCDRQLDSLAAATPPNLDAMFLRACRAAERGQFARSASIFNEMRQLDVGNFFTASPSARVMIDLWGLRRPDLAVALLDSLVDAKPALDALPGYAGLYADAGKPDRARALLASMPHRPESARVGAATRGALAAIALAEGRWSDAVDAYKAADRLPDGPANSNVLSLPINLALVYDRAGLRDSAIAMYMTFLTRPYWQRAVADGIYLPHVYERLGDLYAASGDPVRSVEFRRKFVDTWRDAEPAVRPRVDAARSALLQATAVASHRPR